MVGKLTKSYDSLPTNIQCWAYNYYGWLINKNLRQFANEYSTLDLQLL